MFELIEFVAESVQSKLTSNPLALRMPGAGSRVLPLPKTGQGVIYCDTLFCYTSLDSRLHPRRDDPWR
jgi:hypothetical protein